MTDLPDDAPFDEPTYDEPGSMLDADAVDDDRAADAALRPRSMAEFVGQPRVRDQLSLLLEAAKMHQRTPDHVLLSGPPGLGKDHPGHDHRS